MIEVFCFKLFFITSSFYPLWLLSNFISIFIFVLLFYYKINYWYTKQCGFLFVRRVALCMCPLLSLDSHNVIYCCKFSCSDWFFCTFPIKHFLVSDLPWCMVSVLELALIFSGACFPRLSPEWRAAGCSAAGERCIFGRKPFCECLSQLGACRATSSPRSQPWHVRHGSCSLSIREYFVVVAHRAYGDWWPGHGAWVTLVTLQGLVWGAQEVRQVPGWGLLLPSLQGCERALRCFLCNCLWRNSFNPLNQYYVFPCLFLWDLKQWCLWHSSCEPR